MTDEYRRALAVHSAAFAEFDAARELYRARKSADAQFLDAKKEFEAANKVYNAAFAQEADQPEN